MPGLRDFLRILYTFIIVTIAWVFFRAESIGIALNYLYHVFQFDFSASTFVNPYDNQVLFKEYFYLLALFVLEYFFITKLLDFYSNSKNRIKGLLFDAALLVLIIFNNPVSDSLSFIYFQF